MNNIIEVKNDQSYKISGETCEWLVTNTDVFTFNVETFEGYQREIQESHIDKILTFLETNFFDPTSILLAKDDNKKKYRIVDGQHRIFALKKLKEKNPKRYAELENYILPVVTMIDVPIKDEIESFITINKTSKKVDTSLALVLKNKIYYESRDIDKKYLKLDYVAVEVALKFTTDKESILYKKISINRQAKKNIEYISLNAFVKITKKYINQIYGSELLGLNDPGKINKIVEKTYNDFALFYFEIEKKWSDLFIINQEYTLMGAIGLNALIISYLTLKKERNDIDLVEFIHQCNTSLDKWIKTGEYTAYSSESGYKKVAVDILYELKIKNNT